MNVFIKKRDASITNDKYLSNRRGQYAERNGARTPWNNQMDIKILHTLMINKKSNSQSVSVLLDVCNISNLILKHVAGNIMYQMY